jgi:hypothetical protein
MPAHPQRLIETRKMMGTKKCRTIAFLQERVETMTPGILADTSVQVAVDPIHTKYIRGQYVEDQIVFWTAGACAPTASLAKDDGPSASGEWWVLWLCGCVDGLESAICRSIQYLSVNMTTELREAPSILNATHLTLGSGT